MSHRFDTSTSALKHREKINTTNALYNLEDWIINHVNPKTGQSVLDLGCGTGKQVFALADLVGPSGSILGIDLSEDAVNEVTNKAKKRNLDFIRAIKIGLDECVDSLKGFSFDLILSAYSIYYAREMKKVILGLRTLLSHEGQILICGPGKGTNQEIIKLMDQFIPGRDGEPVQDFIGDDDIKEISQYYNKLKRIELDNKIFFYSVDQVMEWWRNHNSYLSEIDDEMLQFMKQYFKKEKKYALTKKVIGIHCHA